MKSNRNPTRSPEEIAGDLGQLVEEGRAMLGAMFDNSTRKTASLRDSFEEMSEKLGKFQSSATRAAQRGVKHGARYARAADDYVHEYPWPILAGGIVLGALATWWWAQRR